MLPSISVVITCYDNLDVLRVVLPYWFDIVYDDYEVIVVDDGSPIDSGIRGYVEGLGFRYFYNDSGSVYSVSSARNLGVWHALNDYIVFSDSDMVPHRYHLLYHAEALSEYTITVGMRHCIDAERGVALSALCDPSSVVIGHDHILIGNCSCVLPVKPDTRIGRHFPALAAGIERPWNFIWGCNYGVKRSHIIDIGGFDESYDGCWGGDDQELQYRLYIRFKLMPVPVNAVGYHIEHSRAANDYSNSVKLQRTLASCDYRNPAVPRSWVGYDPNRHYL